MNRIYLVSTDGRIFFLDPSNSHFELLETEQLKESNIKIKKLFSSNWCFWCILANFEVCLFVFQLDTPIKYQAITYENQRRYNILNKNSFTDKLLPTDRYQFSSENGSINLPKDSFKLPSYNWSWDSDWVYEQTMSDGWEYSIDFPATYHSKFFTAALTRRRKWLRARTFNSVEQFIHIESPKDNECIIDLAIGGWDIEYCDKGFICVWCISNMGKVFFRENVSFNDPEGNKWKQISLPQDSMGAFSGSCSNTGLFGVVTYNGNALIRFGITRNEPYGTHWIEIQKPSSIISLRQISVGMKVVWALDNQGYIYYRTGIENQSQNKFGTKWTEVPGNLSFLSISCTNQLWAINEESRLCYRDGISDNSLSGQSWKVVNLEFKRNENSKRVFFRNEESDNNDVTASIEETDLATSMKTIVPAENSKSIIDETNIYNEKSIYDSVYESSNTDYIYNNSKSNNNNSETNGPDSKPKIYTKIQIQDPNTIDYKNIALNSENIDNFIEKLKEEEAYKENHKEKNDNKCNSNSNSVIKNTDKPADLKSSRSDSTVSNTISIESSYYASENTLNTNALNNYNHERDSATSLVNFDIDDNFDDVTLKYIDAGSCKIQSDSIPLNWVENIVKKNSLNNQLLESEMDKKSEWRLKIYDALLRRNHMPFKDSHKFQKAIDESSWTSKNEFKYIGKNSKLYLSTLEIESKNDKKYLNVKIMKKPSVIKEEFSIDLKDILCVTRCSVKGKSASATFSVYKRNDIVNPLVFIAHTEKILIEWVSQISSYCSKIAAFNTINQAFTMTDNDGNIYFANLDKSNARFIRSINGHLSLVEKHVSGIVIGVGYNGKLWILQQPGHMLLESYKGSSVQIDDVEVYTYENQRWNVLTGFSNLGFPTDRYAWSDETGREKRYKEDCSLPSSLFTWCSDWQIDFSVTGGVDKDGWQYAIDFPRSYHPVKTNLDFVRRRRWCRKCKTRLQSYWIEVFQNLTITSISFDIDVNRSAFQNDSILLWATESDGNVLCALINKETSAVFSWKYVPTETTFKYITIGTHLKVYGLTTNGNVFFRYSVNAGSNYCGTTWSVLESPKMDVKMKQISAGDCTLWAISEDDSLYFRDNITKTFPEGTHWVKIADFIQYVTVNANNEVYAIESSSAKDKNGNMLLYREGINKDNLVGIAWKSIISINAKMISNRGLIGR